MTLILAMDQGTTSSRSIVFDEQGAIRAVAQQEFTQVYPQSGWVEHDAEEIWRTQLETAQQVLASDEIEASDVAAIGITNQRETVVVWDRTTGTPICNAIVWQDRRTADHCAKLKSDGLELVVQEKTGLLLDPYFSATKLAWILDHVDGAREGAQRGDLCAGTIDSWLAFKLTGGRAHITDASNASRTLLFNTHTGDWDDELLNVFDVPREVLPEVRDSSGVIATVDVSWDLGGVPIAGIIGDQQGALMGQACTSPGLAKNTYGTGCFMLMNTGETRAKSKNRLLSTIAWRMNGVDTCAIEGSVFIGGAVVQWLRDELHIIDDAAEVEALARTVEDTGGVVLVPAFAGLGAPHWDPRARGAIFGITRGMSAGHLARAALEGIAFQVADLNDAMAADAGEDLSELRVDGGAAANDLLLQLQADLMQRPLVRPKVLETTALGAALMARMAIDGNASLDAIESGWAIDRRFEPAISADQAQSRRARWKKAVERSKEWED